ncbi:hypothetical protein EAG_02498 [Camponotus floridanus]|uniref:Uncharacterized protein n=1 Tax=Camponotus floridanus TaxID=104421 RepID=E2A6V9_CAMFO|nr:hypothetical protein EAG_02498 [Camponotus floridanus]
MARKKFSPLLVFQETSIEFSTERLPSFLLSFLFENRREIRKRLSRQLDLTSLYVDENEFGTVEDQKTSESFTSSMWEEFSRSVRWETATR